MIDPVLFNCLPGNRAPDWSEFASLFARSILVVPDGFGGWDVESGVPEYRATEWSVYGRLKSGERHAITDCPTRAAAEDAAKRISEISGLRIET